jgi:diacylglycerol kinase
MGKQTFSFIGRLSSFRHALNGFLILLREEHNARIHLVAAMVVIAAGFYFHISALEWIAVLLCVALVLALELVNSAIEALSDYATTDKHELIKKFKDLAAGAVLIASIIALVVGMIVFVPKVFAI